MDAEMLLATVASDDGRLAVGLPERQVAAGDETEITVELTGRTTTWGIETVAVRLAVPYGDDQTAILAETTVVTDETVDPEPTATQTGTLAVPEWAPHPIGNVDVIVETTVRTDHGDATGRNALKVRQQTFEAAFDTALALGYVPRGFELAATDDDGTPPYEQRVHLAPPDSEATAEPTTTLVCRPSGDGLAIDTVDGD
jgi:sporulation-control protein spo0M